MKSHHILLVATLLTLLSCDDSNIEPSASLFNNWEEIQTDDTNSQLEGAMFTSLKLKTDSSYQLSYHTWSDVARYGDPCHEVDDYYSKGQFSVDNGFIFFKGCCSDSTCIECQARCDGQMDYDDKYAYAVSKDTLKLVPLDNLAHIKILVLQGN